MPTDHSQRPLGKHAARHDPRTLQFANYLKTAVSPPTAFPPPPDDKSWAAAITGLGPMLNDTIGDCTCAAAGHLVQDWTSNLGAQAVVSDGAILAAYRAVSGYQPGKPETDQGAVGLDVLKYWRKTGIGGHKIIAFAGLEPGNHEHVKDALVFFGGVYLGLELPKSAQTQEVWSLPPGGPAGAGAPGSWGGHAVPVVAYDPQGLTVITWGALKRMTWAFLDAYSDEAYAVLSREWLDSKGVSPSGFNLAGLLADLAGVRDRSASRSTSAALATRVCKLAASDAGVLLQGEVFAESDHDNVNSLAKVVVSGPASNPFSLAPGDYRYRFDIETGKTFDLSLTIDGSNSSCDPSKFDAGDGTISRITEFSV